jgi:alanine racemase
VRPAIEERLAGASLPALPRTAWLEIDLEALRANLVLLRTAAGPDVAVRPVVKADAYGHGVLPVARTLLEAGADGLCVAALDEALVLRDAGLTAPVLVLYPVPAASAPVAAARDIRVSAGDPALLADTLEALERAPADLPPLAIELEVETGLGRGGFRVDEIAAAAAAVGRSAHAVATGLWTHLQDPADPAATDRQLVRFDAAAATVAATGSALPARHVTASTGLVSDDIAAYDGIRPGLALYGLVPDELGPTRAAQGIAARLQPVLSLHARAVRVTDLPAGWGISYGPTFTTTRPSRIATLPLGYGDGWSRAWSNRADALVRGRRVPIVGNVAMDAIMVDVTDVPGAPVGLADEFTLIGAQGDERITVADLARTRTTTSWEVVTSFSRRLPRVYHAASGPVGLRTLDDDQGRAS